jgi:Flp pilus assembly protein CpaB
VRGRRSAYIVVFLVAALGAGVLAYLAQPRTEIVRARSNIAVLTPITADMLEVVRVSPGDAAAQTARSIDAVVGRYAATPVLAGQDVDLRTLEDNPGQRAFGFGAPLGAGEVAFALPVDASQAVGGALAAGARVDVVAVPNSLKTQAGGGAPGTAATATSMGQGLVVLAIRTADGQPLTSGSTGDQGSRAVVAPKLGSVVVAIPEARVTDFATAALTSTFYLALSPAAPASANP